MNALIINEGDTPIEIVANGKVVHSIAPGATARQAGNLEVTLQDGAAEETKEESDES